MQQRTKATLAGAFTLASAASASALDCDPTQLAQYFDGQAAAHPGEEYAVVTSAQRDGTVCVVQASVRSRANIHFEARLPATWNRRFFFHGGAGTDGVLPKAVGNMLGNAGLAIDEGYAVVSTDGGHQSFGDWFQVASEVYATQSTFGRDPELRIDYGYRAVDLVTKSAKKLISAYYGDAIQKSYFVGCSNGGRQALMAATRFQDQYDAILAGAPAMNISSMAFQAVQDVQELSKFSDTPGAALTDENMRYVASKILSACDSLDGANDGMVGDPIACQQKFNPDSAKVSLLNWSGLPAAKVDALTRMMAGIKLNGEPLYASWLWDPGIAANMITGQSWRTWRMESALGLLSGQPFPIMVFIGGGALANLIASPPLTNAPNQPREMWNYLKSYNVAIGYPNVFYSGDARFLPAHYVYDVPNPSVLDAFQTHGKLIVFSGSADGTVSTNDVINWYAKLRDEDTRNGRNTDSYARLYLVPGMGHCGGGVATDKFDLFAQLESWVEHAVAPSDAQPPIATVNGGNLDAPSAWRNKRSRPLCAYPKIARYQGGDLESAASFRCVNR
jgi:feruloyl esterase